MSPNAFLVTGAGTDIGKTFATCGLARALRDAGRRPAVLKPVMSGLDPERLDRSDAGLLLGACGIDPTARAVAAISPWRFAAPLSPDMAAELEGRSINFPELLQFCVTAVRDATDILLIEGVGGVMAPVGERHTMLDLAAKLGLPTLLLGGTHLGAISHLLTAHAALAARGVAVAHVVLSESELSPVPPARTAQTLARFLPGQPISILPRFDPPEPAFALLAAALTRG